MIDTNELRVGSYVNSIFGQTTVYSVSVHKVLIYSADKKTIHNGTKHGIKPISLTPEILEKCGFEHKILGDEEIDGGESHYIKNNIWFCHVDNDWYLSGAIEHKPFNFLHQLQNLYYALAQTELIYKP